MNFGDVVVLALTCPVTLIGRERSRDLLGHALGQGQDHIITNFELMIVHCQRRTVWNISTDKPSSAELIIWS